MKQLIFVGDFFNSKSKHTPPTSSEITEVLIHILIHILIHSLIFKEQQQQDLKLLFFEQNALLDKALKIDPQNSLIYFEKAELLYKVILKTIIQLKERMKKRKFF